MIKIIGANGIISNVDNFLKEIEIFAKNKNLVIQVFDADMIYSKNHLISAYDHAVRSINRKKNSTNSLEKEILLYASGERQLKIAIPKMGIKKGKSNIAFIFINNQMSDKTIKDFLKFFSLSRNDDVLIGDINTLKKFGITKNEIETVTKEKFESLILEKVALVDIIK